MINNFVKRIGLLVLIFLFLVFSVSPVRADETLSSELSAPVAQLQAGPTGVTGPTGPTGVLGPTGPNRVTGHIDPATTAVQADNTETGALSSNQNKVADSNQTDLSINDQSQTDNTANLDLTSGTNTIERNSVVGSVTTGDIDTSVNVLNIDSNSLASGSTVSSTTLDGAKIASLDLADPANAGNQLVLSADLLNSLTGFDSQNLNSVDRNNLINILFNDNSQTKNLLNINADTGNNHISENTSIGDIQTGNINIIANILNLKLLAFPINLGLDIYTVLKGLTGDIIINNNETGSQSDNTNSVSQQQNADLSVNNQSNTANNFDFNLNTGQNDLNRNSAINNVQTGTIQASQNAFNITNPVFYIINVFGNFLGNVFGLPANNYVLNILGSGGTAADNGSEPNNTGSVNGSNDQTGDSSTNLNSLDQNSTLQADINNNSEINNRINVNANTGRNKITANTLIDNVQTGAINVMGNVANLYQLLLGGSKDIKVKIINIFGDWTGNLRTPGNNAGQSSDTQNQADPEVIDNPTVEISATDQSDPVDTSIINNTVTKSVRHIATDASYLSSIDNIDIKDITNPEVGNNTNNIPADSSNKAKDSKRKLLTFIIPGLVLALSVSSEILDKKRRISR